MDIFKLLSQVAQSGVLGVFCVIFMFVIWKLFNLILKKQDELNEEKDKRLSDSKVYQAASDSEKEATRKTLEILTGKIDGALQQK